MRILRSRALVLAVGLCTLGALDASARADKIATPPAPTTHDLGAWDCSGSPAKDVIIAPGEHVYVWHGECRGAEGYDVVIEPRPRQLQARMSFDARTKVLSLRVTNAGGVTTVKMHVFVGFA